MHRIRGVLADALLQERNRVAGQVLLVVDPAERVVDLGLIGSLWAAVWASPSATSRLPPRSA